MQMNMVKLKFIINAGALCLRISEGKERFYKRVCHLLQGNPNLRHFNVNKQKFTAYAVCHKENNKALEDFHKIYWDIIQEHPEMGARQVNGVVASQSKAVVRVEDLNNVATFLETVVKRERAKQGCNFELYDKLLKKCLKVIPRFSSISFKDIDYNAMVGFATIFAAMKGYRWTTKTFRATLGRAHKEAGVDFRLSQIGDFNFADYDPDRYKVKDHKPDVLSPEQLKAFLNADPSRLTPLRTGRKSVELYHDFCVFMFHTFFSPCDVIKLKLDDITDHGTVVARRKKTHKQVEVPITPVMQKIIDKYRGQSEYGYVFPIKDDRLDAIHKTKDCSFKKFRERVNQWLKDVGVQLHIEGRLYPYVFRHTAITFALNNGIPIAYVAQAAGTSIKMIQKHYYNGNNAKNQGLLSDVFMRAGA